jgi:hypothetical protein
MRVARKVQAAQFAANIPPIIRDILTAYTSLNVIAGQLNARKVATANGGRWRHVQVRQIFVVGSQRPAVKAEPVEPPVFQWVLDAQSQSDSRTMCCSIQRLSDLVS